MEGSKSESVFDSMNLNPQLFIDTTINNVDDIVDEAFDFFGREASAILKIDGGSDNNKSKELSNGIERVRGMIQSVLDNRLEAWEGYSLNNSFAVPEEFVLPETETAETDVDSDRTIQDDLELDEQLDSLRHKLNLAGKRSAEVNSELQALERTSVSKQQSARLVNDALELYAVDDMFEEMVKAASELRAEIDKLKTRRMKDVERGKVERLKNHGEEFYATISDEKLEGYRKFLGELRKI